MGTNTSTNTNTKTNTNTQVPIKVEQDEQTSLQIEEIENALTQENVFVAAEDPKENVELKQENLERTSTCSEDAGPAGTSVQKSTDGKNENLRKPTPQKRRPSDTKDNVLVSIRKFLNLQVLIYT